MVSRRCVLHHRYFCVICFTLPDSQAIEIPHLLRSLLHRPEFRTEKNRMGKVIRVTALETSYYAFDDKQIRVILL